MNMTKLFRNYNNHMNNKNDFFKFYLYYIKKDNTKFSPNIYY